MSFMFDHYAWAQADVQQYTVGAAQRTSPATRADGRCTPPLLVDSVVLVCVLVSLRRPVDMAIARALSGLQLHLE
jgi:hypothetical protein